MIVLGVDPSLVNLGYAVVSRVASGKHVWLDSGTEHTVPADPIPNRLAHLAKTLQRIIDEHRPEMAIVEKPAIHGNYGRATGRSGDDGDAKALGTAASRADFNTARGAILVTLALAGVRVVEVPASKVSKPGRALQNRIVFPLLVKRTSEHERDALFYTWAGPLPLMPLRRIA